MMPGVTDLASCLLARLDDRLPAAGDAVRAAGMAAYMRDQFAFAGVPAPALRAVERAAVQGLPAPTCDDLRSISLACWERAEREYQYVACDYLRSHLGAADASFLATLEFLITTKSWWDTVDALATRVTGGLVKRYPALVSEMDAWSRSPNVWLIRTAILYQLHYGEQTDATRLFGYCLRQVAHRDFFVRKAIGWALRHYARTDPEAVREFVVRNRARLSPLSVKEATKHL
jgi:3-methyladenine DNA glycosylase AlkD